MAAKQFLITGAVQTTAQHQGLQVQIKVAPKPVMPEPVPAPAQLQQALRPTAPAFKPRSTAKLVERTFIAKTVDVLAAPDAQAMPTPSPKPVLDSAVSQLYEDERFVRATEVDTPPKRITAIAAIEFVKTQELPPLMLDVFVNKDGSVQAINTLNYQFPDPQLIERIRAALKQVRFKPALKNDVPVDAIVRFIGNVDELGLAEVEAEFIGPPHESDTPGYKVTANSGIRPSRGLVEGAAGSGAKPTLPIQ